MAGDSSAGRVVIVMGVSGSGKSTLGERLAGSLGWIYLDADDFHPQANIEKIRRGVALTDQDRRPWLDGLIERLNQAPSERVVLACSALTHAIRQRFRDEVRNDVAFVYLAVDREPLHTRLTERKGHYAKVDLLDRQLRTLEEPTHDDSIVVQANGSVEDTFRQLRDKLASHRWPADRA